MKQILKKDNIAFIIVVIIAIILKQFLMLNFPIAPYIFAGEDDALMVRLAKNIADGKWLGEFSYNTLVKGPVFPMVLALLYKLKFSYITTMTILYTIACIVFTWSIRNIVKSKKILVLMFILLLFNPIMYSLNGIQRVYRNAFVPTCVLLIIGSYISIFNNCEEKIKYSIGWVGLISVIFPLFYYTREDSIWMVPFVIFMSLVILITYFIRFKKVNFKIITVSLFLILPILTLNLFTDYIETKNEKNYGIRLTNIQSKTNFAAAMKAIYMVKPNVYIDKVNVPLEKVERMGEVSESFKLIIPELRTAIAGYNACDGNPEDGEVEDGWFSWALMTALENTGFRGFPQQQDICERICVEINKAMAEGKLEIQKTGPIASTAVWRSNYNMPFIQNIFKSMWYVASLDGIRIKTNLITVSNENEKEIANLFLEITNDDFEYKTSDMESDKEISNYKIDILNFITKLYRIISIVLFILGICGYTLMTIIICKDIFNKKYDLLKYWIITSGILGAFFTLIVGIAFTTTTMVYAINSLYLCAGYPLLMMFGALSSNYLIEYVYKKIGAKIWKKQM